MSIWLGLAVLLVQCALPGTLRQAWAFGGKSSSEQQKANSADSAAVWVMRPDGSQMCTANSGQSLDAGAADLRKAGIRVISSQKGNDSKMHAQMCGLPTGHTNAYQISQDDLAKAITLGFQKIEMKTDASPGKK
jgi:hypothetical protein